jgi:hypothetical protein
LLLEEERQQTYADYHRSQVKTMRDRVFGEQAARNKPNGADAEGGNVVLPQISVSSFAAARAPPREWHVPDLIPANQVPLFGGGGKVGKSKLAMQLCVATAAELDWLGMKPASGPVICVGAEDDIPEFPRRFEEIADSYGIRLDQLKHPLILIPMADRDAVLAATVKAGRIAPTGVWHGLEQARLSVRLFFREPHVAALARPLCVEALGVDVVVHERRPEHFYAA